MMTDPQFASPTRHETASGRPVVPTRRNGWWRAVLFTLKAIEVRLRFVAVLVAIGLFIAYFPTIENYWDRWTRPATDAAAALEPDSQFYCPMHPSVVRDHLDPGGAIPKCSICGMPLSQRKKGVAAALPDGVITRLQLSPQRVQMAGIRTEPVAYRPLVHEVQTVGYVDFDQSRLAKIVSRVGGYVEKLYVDKTFSTVAQGDPLAEIYSPQLYSSVQELLLARDRGLKSLVESSRTRLKLLGIGEREIDEILRNPSAGARLVIRSPQSGHVIVKNIVQGEAVEPGTMLFEVAEMSVVWIEAEVFEQDIPFLKQNQQIEATVEALPNRVFRGKVSLVHPHLETATRTNRVRFEIENPNHELRPGMYAMVRLGMPLAQIEPFRSALAAAAQPHPEADADAALPPEPADPDEVLSVPRGAVVDTGSQKIVYVEHEPGVFDGIAVELGARSGEYYPVIKGLHPGDRVAAAGAFLIDAETRLQPAAAGTYFGAGGTSHGSMRAPAGQQAEQPGDTSPRDAAPRKPPPGGYPLLQKLPPLERALALWQQTCPITGLPLGKMGVPRKMQLGQRTIFLCCESCEPKVKQDPQAALRKLPPLAVPQQPAPSTTPSQK